MKAAKWLLLGVMLIISITAALAIVENTANANKEAIAFCEENDQLFLFTGYDMDHQRVTLCYDNVDDRYVEHLLE